MPANKIRVFLAHQDGLVAAGMAAILSAAHDIELVNADGGVGEAGAPWRSAAHGHADVRAIMRFADVVVTDYEGAMICTSASGDSLKVVAVTRIDAEVRIRLAMERGIRGYLSDACTADEFLAAVRDVSRGVTVLSREVSLRVAESFTTDSLTKRETTVLQALMFGLSNKLIAAKLTVSEATVKSHVKTICAKLRARGRSEAASIAWRRGLVSELSVSNARR